MSAASEHDAIRELLPWYVNGTLEQHESARVSAHLGECARCRGETDELRELQAAVRETSVEAHDRPSPAATWGRVPSMVRWALAAQLLLIVALAALWLSSVRREPAQFTTLADPSTRVEAGGLRLRVVFESDATEAQVRRLLLEHGGRFVDGPSAVGAYEIEVASGTADTLDRMRADSLTQLVEPLP